MDIHPPSGPTHSFKDFAIHIVIVTIGILIALGLEGLRESIHEHRLVREARENFRAEIQQDRQHMTLELENVAKVTRDLDALDADLPALEKDPVQLKARVNAIEPSLYFLSSSSWTAALSSGALSHMTDQEVSRYATFDFIVRSYSGIEDRVMPQYLAFQAYVRSRQSFGPQESAQTEEKLLEFEMYTHVMSHVGRECATTLDAALAEK